MKYIITEKQLKVLIKEQSQENQCTEQDFKRMDGELNNVLSSANIYLSPDEKEEIQPNCPIETDSPPNLNDEQKSLLSNAISKMSQMDKKELVGTLKELVGLKTKVENKTVAESDLTNVLTILGIGGAVWLLSGPMIAFLIMGGVVLLSRLIFRGPCAERGRKRSGCKRRKGLGLNRR